MCFTSLTWLQLEDHDSADRYKTTHLSGPIVGFLGGKKPYFVFPINNQCNNVKAF